MNLVGCTILDCDNVGLLLRDCKDIHREGVLISDRREGSKSVRVRVIDATGKVVSTE
jgi:hypothetical protein